MKRAFEVGARYSFECVTHGVQLTPADGDPVFSPLYGTDGTANPLTDRTARPNGSYVIDLSFVVCPAAAEDEACEPSWRIWVDA